MPTSNPTFVKGLDARQATAYIFVSLTFADFAARANVIDIGGPPGSQVVAGGSITIATPNNDTGTATLKIGDSVDDDRYLAATSVKTAAGTNTAIVPTGYLATGAVSPFLRLTLTPQNANATAGEVRVAIPYVTLNKSDWVQD